MSGTLRVIDSGLNPARFNLSLTEALCRLHRAGDAPDTLRFQHFNPAAIIGRHQLLNREVNLPWVAQNGVETARRMTGGGAIVMGPGILGWELIIARARVPQALGEVSALLCTGLAQGLSRLGVEAAYRPRNDIEINGRKVSGTGGYFDGDTLVFQGTVLVELDATLLTQALNLPAHKLGKRGLESFLERVIDLREVLGKAPDMEVVKAAVTRGLAGALGLEAQASPLPAAESALAETIFATEIGTDAFVTGADDAQARMGQTLAITRPTPGGTLEVAVKLLDGAAGIVDQVLITGDYFVSPPRVIADLEAHLRHKPLGSLAGEAEAFLAARQAGFLGMAASDIATALTEAARQET
jgi:lipoate---protein ligase